MNSYLNSLYLPLKYHLLSINWNHRRDEVIFLPLHSCMHACMHPSILIHSFSQSVSHSCMHVFIHSFTGFSKFLILLGLRSLPLHLWAAQGSKTAGESKKDKLQTNILSCAQLWNKLPEDVKLADNVNIFKSKLRSIQL